MHKQRGPAHRGRPVRVLVVDDSAVVRQACDALLRNRGLEVVTAADPLIAMEKMRKSRPEVVLLDLTMPRMDGLELLSWVRSRKRWRELPVILFTGSNRDEDRLLAMQRGATAYVVKELLMRPPPSLFQALQQYVPQAARRVLSRTS